MRRRLKRFAPDNPIVERTGRDANQTAPDFAEEVEFDRPPVEVPQIAPVAGSVRLSDVAVSENIAAEAAPLKDWTPVRDEGAPIALVHQPGELLGGQWVRRQFVSNGMIGVEVPLDRIVGLVQLINRAYVENGYINSGVLVGRRAASRRRHAPTQTDLWPIGQCRW